MLHRGRLLAVCLALTAAGSLTAAGCASIPSGRYGVASVDFAGVEEVDEVALAACLATHEREHFDITFGRNPEPVCGVPPFDSGRVTLHVLRWPWSDWPLFDRSVFERDVDRIARWYRARGYYEARVLAAEVDPAEALEPRYRAEDTPPACTEDCEVDVTFTIVEGEPVLVRSIAITGADTLDADLQSVLEQAVVLEPGERFDEALYDRTKQAMANALAEASFAHAIVTGHVEIEPGAHAADLRFEVDSGPSCRFSDITVAPIDPGPDCNIGSLTLARDLDIPLDVVRSAALLDRGDPFSKSAISDAQRAIYGLGAFGSVEVLPDVPEDRTVTEIPVTIRAVPGRICRFAFGVGAQSGVSDLLESDAISTPQWDLHLLAVAEFRHFLGGLRRLRLEERPRLIFLEPFPQATEPQFGNLVRLEFQQPSFIEPRTALVFRTDYDVGPDAFRGYFRHDVNASLGPERYFLDGRLFLTVRLRTVLLFPIDDGANVPSDSRATLLEQFARLDLRDDPQDPTLGFYAQIGLQEAGVLPLSSWNYFRITPELRVYLPLPFGVVLAGRAAVGAMFILDASDSLDPESADLGPDRFRLRGGGPNSNRGYIAGQLGDSNPGGLRRWEASLELRVPITENWRLALFGDVGDVHRGRSAGIYLNPESPRFRLDHPHLSVGFGIRYYLKPIGAIRLDFGWAVPGMQVLGQDPPPRSEYLGIPGAWHFTIGEAF